MKLKLEMNKILIGFTSFAIIVLIMKLIFMDYSDLSWANNSGTYLLINSIFLLIVVIYMFNRNKKKEDN
jgi:hypothetical protein